MNVPQETLQLLQVQFNKVIDSRVKDLMDKNDNTYPDLTKYNEDKEDGQEMYHAIGGMYGGFCYYIKKEDDEYVLYSSSWSRICGGSGETHRVTTHSFELIEQGFA